MKIPIVQTNEFILYLEYFNEMYWLHTDVYKWSAEVKKNYVRELNQLQSLLNAPLYGLVDNDKLGKFAVTIGFIYVKDLKGNDGNVYKIYTRSL
jgi:hypothetical protein